MTIDEIFEPQKSAILDKFGSSFYQYDLIEEGSTIVEHNSIPRISEEHFKDKVFSHFMFGCKLFPIFKIKK